MDTIPPDVADDQIWHAYPEGDLREHETETRGACWCRPTIQYEGCGWLVVHNSMDGREDFEEGRRKPS